LNAPGRLRALGERLAHNRRFTVGLSLALVAALVLVAATSFDLHGLGRSLARVRPGWLVLALALMGSSFLARAESWYVAIRSAMPQLAVDRAAVRRSLLVGMAGSAVAPGRVGEAVRAWLIARHAPDPPRAFAIVVGTVVLQALLNSVALLVLLGIAISGAAAVRATALAGTGAALAAALALLALAPRLLLALERRRSRAMRAGRWLAAQLVRIRYGLRVLRQPRAALHSGAAQMGAWGLQLATCWVVLQALRATPHGSLAAAAAVLVAVNVTAVVPVTPSNVGVFQAACIAALAPFGVAAALALAYGLVLQGVEIACDLGMGIPSLIREGVSFGEVRRAARAARLSADEPDKPPSDGGAPEPPSHGGARPKPQRHAPTSMPSDAPRT
jgi:phosphatidylinositol alpha-mannosyltransferase